MNITKKVLFFSIFFFISMNAKAQFGFKAGINLPNVSVENNYSFINIETENKIGFNFGAFVNVKEDRSFSISTGLTFERKKIKGKGFINPFSTQTAEQQVDYLIYSVTGKYTFLELEKTSPYVFLSPRLNFYLGNEISPTIPQSQQDIITDKMKKLGFGLSIGGGVEFARNNPVIPFMELQFSPDFFNAYDDRFISFKSNAIEIMIGARIK
jgi:hypothetical protein